MQRRIFALCFLSISLVTAHTQAGWKDLVTDLKESSEQYLQKSDTTSTSTQLDLNTMIAGLKEALQVGSQRVVENVSAPGGYLNNPDIRIPLPPSIEKVSGILKKYGLKDQVNQFEESINRAAENAAPQATELLVNAVKEMSFEDAKKIYQGADNAATEYFEKHTRDQLQQLFKPKVNDSLQQVGATRYYSQLAGKAKDLPYVGDQVNVDLDSYVTDQALDGLFTMLAVEEKKIRENPAARTTELLKQVFGQ
ncbi:DUF4197 domain-containing protein [Neptuniibacter sp. CAU 1671]|uniref:DUF4197 domain-containing protein n=1 Tax=Neptuniibacter sp. CAU 1671 TaxID=3032593 RepID=UPI0023DA19AE|nr:DUF4197 domain-containing protein [Neptuniibacter sp. CAU 1671]MDF2180669.1 DUF4197 domain-containing protein [Neptuniibacter sp. CAU 1671]